MTPELQICITDTKEQMNKAIAHLENELLKIRAGRASTTMVDSVLVDYYGNQTPLDQVSNLSTPDPKTIVIQPWEKSMIAVIEKAILEANLGLNPQNDGDRVMINVPVLTEERRLELVKKVKEEAENAKVSIRNIRRDANETIKAMTKNGLSVDMAKDGEAQIQAITDEYSGKVDRHVTRKDEEIMKV